MVRMEWGTWAGPCAKIIGPRWRKMMSEPRCVRRLSRFPPGASGGPIGGAKAWLARRSSWPSGFIDGRLARPASRPACGPALDPPIWAPRAHCRAQDGPQRKGRGFPPVPQGGHGLRTGPPWVALDPKSIRVHRPCLEDSQYMNQLMCNKKLENSQKYSK